MVDNQLCRLVLSVDSRLPACGFMSASDAAAVAADAIARIDTLGFVGIQELPSATWSGLSGFFGFHIEPLRTNVTPHAAGEASVPPDEPIDVATLELLEQRTVADGLLFRHVSRRLLGDERLADGLADSAFALQLVRFTTLLGRAVALDGLN
jgi:hypothetical protein